MEGKNSIKQLQKQFSARVNCEYRHRRPKIEFRYLILSSTVKITFFIFRNIFRDNRFHHYYYCTTVTRNKQQANKINSIAFYSEVCICHWMDILILKVNKSLKITNYDYFLKVLFWGFYCDKSL